MNEKYPRTTCIHCDAFLYNTNDKLCPVCEIEYETDNEDDIMAYNNAYGYGHSDGWSEGYLSGQNSAYEDRAMIVIAFFFRVIKARHLERIRDVIKQAIYEYRHKSEIDSIPF